MLERAVALVRPRAGALSVVASPIAQKTSGEPRVVQWPLVAARNFTYYALHPLGLKTVSGFARGRAINFSTSPVGPVKGRRLDRSAAVQGTFDLWAKAAARWANRFDEDMELLFILQIVGHPTDLPCGLLEEDVETPDGRVVKMKARWLGGYRDAVHIDDTDHVTLMVRAFGRLG